MHAAIRPATVTDADAIATIYNQGIEDRVATFETRLHAAVDFEPAVRGGGLPFLVASIGDRVLGFARLSGYSDRCCYAGVGEAAVYVERSARGGGVGRRLLEALAEAAAAAGRWKVIGLLFDTNHPSRALFARCGYREVGVFRRHGRLDGEWRDVVVVERLVGEAARR